MPRDVYTPSTKASIQGPDRLQLFIQRAQHELVYARRRQNRLPLHDSFRLTLPARSSMRPTIYLDPESEPAA